MPQTPQQQQLDPFEALPLGPATPGQPDAANVLEFPRPAGPDASAAEAAPEPANPRNPHIRFQRLSVNALPAQQVTLWHPRSLLLARQPASAVDLVTPSAQGGICQPSHIVAPGGAPALH